MRPIPNFVGEKSHKRVKGQSENGLVIAQIWSDIVHKPTNEQIVWKMQKWFQNEHLTYFLVLLTSFNSEMLPIYRGRYAKLPAGQLTVIGKTPIGQILKWIN